MAYANKYFFFHYHYPLINYLITSRAGVRLRVVNTDAEGRMAMVDVLAHMKEKALNEVKK